MMNHPPCACSMDGRHRRRNPPLVLYAPLISTRRSSTSETTDVLPRSTSGLRLSVPFSWESSPGIPRPHITDDEDDVETPPPKPPPSRRENGKSMQVLNHETRTPDSGEEEVDEFSDALEAISVSSDKFDVTCSPSSFGTGDKPPSFIMSRFLPAADALAKSSVRHSDGHDPSPSYQLRKEAMRARFKQRAVVSVNDRHRNVPSSDLYGADAPAELPSMACGLMLFFPCSFKPTACRFKSPVQPAGTPRPGNPSSTPKKFCASNNGDHGGTSSSLKSPDRNLNDGWSTDKDGGGGSGHHVVKPPSVKLRHPHRWRPQARVVEKWKSTAIRMRVAVHEAETKQRSSSEEVVAPAAESRRRGNTWRLPRLSRLD